MRDDARGGPEAEGRGRSAAAGEDVTPDGLHRHLDGETSREALGAGGRSEAGAWDRMLDAFREEDPRAPAPPWLEQRVMAEIERIPEPGRSARIARWLVRPRSVAVSPLAAGLVAAALAVVLLLPGRVGDGGAGGDGGGASADAETVVYVQFLLEAPGATSVAVAGDFTGWRPAFTLEDPDGDGVWSARVPVRPGVHGYMFLIDGSEWQTDPNAERYRDDGFGGRNAVLAVTAGT